LTETLKEVDILLINDGEAKLLAGDSSLPRAARKVLQMGPRALVIKHGEYGATSFSAMARCTRFAPRRCRLTKCRTRRARATHSAGGFMGYIASQSKLDRSVLTKAMFYGGVMGSFAVERFGTEPAANLDDRGNRGALRVVPQPHAPGVGGASQIILWRCHSEPEPPAEAKNLCISTQGKCIDPSLRSG